MTCVVGGDTGLIKAIDWTRAKRPKISVAAGDQDRNRGIAALAHGRDASEVFAVRQDGTVDTLEVEEGAECAPAKQLEGELPVVPVAGTALHFHHPDQRLYACAQDGTVAVCKVTGDSLGEPSEFKVRPPVACAAFHSPQGRGDQLLLAVGGRDNDVVVHVASEEGRVEWRGRGLPHDSLGLARKMHPLAVCFLPRKEAPSLLAVATAQQELRVYDWAEGDETPRTKQGRERPPGRTSRPMREFKPSAEWLGSGCVTAMVAAPSFDERVFIGDNMGGLYLADLKNGSLVTKYRGGCGAVYGLAPHPKLPFVANVGLARKAYCHDIGAGTIVAQVFLKQRLTAVLWLHEAKAVFEDTYTLKAGGQVAVDDENEAWLELDEVEKKQLEAAAKPGDKRRSTAAVPKPKVRRQSATGKRKPAT